MTREGTGSLSQHSACVCVSSAPDINSTLMASLLYNYGFWIGLTAITPMVVFYLSKYVVQKVAEDMPQNVVMQI